MTYDASVEVPVVLFGAFDRHNFGDLLFPHIAAAMLPGRELLFAGLADRDLRHLGGHRVTALAHLAPALGGRACRLLCVGGEILTCSAWEAAVMLLPPAEVQQTVAYLEARPGEQRPWVQRFLGTAALAPYTVSRTRIPGVGSVSYGGVGGVALDRIDPGMRREVLATLAEADALAVRDAQTLQQLAAAGVAARLLPDPAVMVAEIFGSCNRQHAREGEVAWMQANFPKGYVAVQFGAEFGDDETLATIASQLGALAAKLDVGIVLWRAGAAPWHDDLASLGRVAARLPGATARVFESIGLWDLCALLAHARAVCCSSLHGRIVASAFAIAHVSLGPAMSPGPPGKAAAYAATWDRPGQPGVVGPHGLAAGVHTAVAVDTNRLHHDARHRASLYRQGFALFCPPETHHAHRRTEGNQEP